MEPDWARKLDAQRRADEDISSSPARLNGLVRASLGIALALAFLGAVAGRWIAHMIVGSAIQPTPARLLIGSAMVVALFAGLGVVARRFGGVAAGAATFVVLGFFGSLTLFLLLAQRQ